MISYNVYLMSNKVYWISSYVYKIYDLLRCQIYIRYKF